MVKLDWNLHNMMKFLPLLLIHCANLHNMVKLSLKQFRAGSNRNNPDIAQHDEILTPPINTLCKLAQHGEIKSETVQSRIKQE